MKITALIPDELVADVQQFTQGKTIADSLIKALSEWVSIQKIKSLNTEVAKSPLVFKPPLRPVSSRRRDDSGGMK